MDEGPAESHAKRKAPGQGGAFRPRHIDLDDGRLVLHPDGAIDHVDTAGQVLGSWAPGDPEWARHAIRFGLQPQASTVAPHGGPDGGMKPPRR